MAWTLHSKLFPGLNLEWELLGLLAEHGREPVVTACLALGHESLRSAEQPLSPERADECKHEADRYARFAWHLSKEEALAQVPCLSSEELSEGPGEEITSAEGHFAEALRNLERQIEALLSHLGPPSGLPGMPRRRALAMPPSLFLSSIRGEVKELDEVLRLLKEGLSKFLKDDLRLFAGYIELGSEHRKYQEEIAPGHVIAYVETLRNIQKSCIDDAPFPAACRALAAAYERAASKSGALVAARSQRTRALESIARIPADAWVPFAKGFASVRELCTKAL